MTALALNPRLVASLHVPIDYQSGETGSPLAGLGAISHYTRNNTIFSEGDDAEYSYKVVAGAVRLSKMLSDGRRQVAEFALPGDFFGINWLGEHSMTAAALNDVAVICYRRGRLERLSDENRAVRAELFSTLRHDLWAAQNHLVILGRHSALERVASFLLQLIDRKKNANKDIIDIPMARQDIADYLGLTIETVCRMLTKLKVNAVIEIPDRHTVKVCSISALRRAARPEE
jgi:CRP/FNR family nitrogen fixation transcriptional regulator